jgi:alkyl hydroperoxide reductase subunit F
LDTPVEPPEDDKHFDVAVIGLGPAGVTASTELVRYGYRVAAFEGDRIGGLIHLARRVDNFPGIAPSSPGTQVVEMLWEHLQRFPPVIHDSDVIGIYHTGVGFGVSMGDSSVTARCLVLATGTRATRLDLPGEELPWVHHRWTEIVTGPGSTVAVIGGGDLAIDQALSIHEGERRVEVLLRSEGTRCNMFLQGELEEARDIHIRTSSPVLRFEEGPGNTVVYSKGGHEVKLPVDAVLVSIGREPNLPDLNGEILNLDRARFLAPQGLFLAGDVVSDRRRQVGIAIGSGLDAAMRCDEFLRRVAE